jgi:TPR repeat protein
MRRLACSVILTLLATTALAEEPPAQDSFDYFFENQKALREKAKKERQQYLFPKGERFVDNNAMKNAIISLRWYAVAGDPESQAAMGDLFAKGLYEVHNLKSAVYWYKLAAQNENLYAMYMVGLSYQMGWLGKVDAEKANEFYSYADSNDDAPRARRQIAQFFADRESAMYNFDQSFRWFESAAESGDVQAQLTLGDFFSDGSRAGKNTMMAVKWYGRAAAKDDPYAQYSLGVIYLQGDKVIPADYNQGIQWIEKSAHQQFAAAQALLGRLYYNGRGVPQSNALAYAWWSLANRENNPDLQEDLAQVTRKMSVEEMNQAIKLAEYYRVKTSGRAGDWTKDKTSGRPADWTKDK